MLNAQPGSLSPAPEGASSPRGGWQPPCPGGQRTYPRGAGAPRPYPRQQAPPSRPAVPRTGAEPRLPGPQRGSGPSGRRLPCPERGPARHTPPAIGWAARHGSAATGCRRTKRRGGGERQAASPRGLLPVTPRRCLPPPPAPGPGRADGRPSPRPGACAAPGAGPRGGAARPASLGRAPGPGPRQARPRQAGARRDDGREKPARPRPRAAPLSPAAAEGVLPAQQRNPAASGKGKAEQGAGEQPSPFPREQPFAPPAAPRRHRSQLCFLGKHQVPESREIPAPRLSFKKMSSLFSL